jgi:NAD(P)-dependent dehydrogenase (short-subunit alcohol dehydrogenase family)
MIKKIIKRIVLLLQKPSKNFTVQNVIMARSDLLSGRNALITGGTSGIGFHLAKAFLGAGAKVVITGRNQDRINKALDELIDQGTYQGKLFGVVMDNANVGALEEKFQIALNCLSESNQDGQIDILVNNAGVLGKGILNTSEEDFDEVIDTNLKGTYFLSRLVGNYFKNHDIEGNILNVASSSSLRPATSAYTLSKWGIRGLTLGLAKALAPYGITVNGIAPGPTATPMLLGSNESSINHSTSPIGRYALPDEIANMAVMLVSPIGRTIVGDILYMTGGAGLITQDDIQYTM